MPPAIIIRIVAGSARIKFLVVKYRSCPEDVDIRMKFPILLKRPHVGTTAVFCVMRAHMDGNPVILLLVGYFIYFR